MTPLMDQPRRENPWGTDHALRFESYTSYVPHRMDITQFKTRLPSCSRRHLLNFSHYINR